MWLKKGKVFDELRAFVDDLPVIETHEHYLGICDDCSNLDILSFIATTGYYTSDLWSISSDFDVKNNGQATDVTQFIGDSSIDFDKRFEVWQTYHERTCHTAYAKAMAEGLKACWGIKELSKKNLLELQEKMRSRRNQSFYDEMYKEHGIKAMIVNVTLYDIISGKSDYNKDIVRLVLDLPQYHNNICNKSEIQKPQIEENLGRKVLSLDDYLEGFEKYLQRCIEFGIVGIKDQSAYNRKIAYENVSRHNAERIFNRIMANPRNTYGTRDVRPLNDFLFHYFMRLARKYKLVVQIHTGHMAGIRNEISKTNAVHFTDVLELHQDVVFDLFHGNWPYMGELLFLGKNYPNVMIDMCWVNAIEPYYSVELFKRALTTVPHTKISGFGGDTGCPEWQVGYLIQAKDNVAIALADMVEIGYLGMDEARQVAQDWLFNNPNRIFGLKLERQV